MTEPSDHPQPPRGVRGAIRVGCASWADPALIESGTFYPAKSMSAEARLRHYAAAFDSVEVNSSYYAIPALRTTALWAARTPPGFTFNVKAFAPMTGHHPRLEALPAEARALLPSSPRLTPRGEVDVSDLPQEAIDATFRAFASALAPIDRAGKLGYVLFQLAPWVRYGDRALEYVAGLPGRLPGWRLAVEVRHRSWMPDHTAETLAHLRTAGLAHVVVDAPDVPNAPPRVPRATAAVAVVRLHGRNAGGWLDQLHGKSPSVREKYDYLYSEAELRALVPELQDLAAEAAHVFVAFNNNNRDYPVRNALMLRRMLHPRADAPPSLAGPSGAISAQGSFF